MRVTITDIQNMKAKGEKVVMLTAYDYATAKILDEASVPIILVGDSLGMVMLGYETTIPVTMEEMLHHTKAVVRGTKRALIVADMPFMTYTVTVEEALRNAARFIQEGGAAAVKLEGGEPVAAAVRRIVDCGIPVMGHLGLTPQSVHQMGGYKVQGKTLETARRILRDAEILQESGVFAIVLETVPAPVAKIITETVRVPTIGIGAGPYCDGQVQVISDILGLFTDFFPKHAKRYASLGQTIKDSVNQYMREVKEELFPTDKESFSMDPKLVEQLAAEVSKVTKTPLG